MVLLIYGSGGLGRGIYDWITRTDYKEKWQEIIFLNDMEDEEEFYGTRKIHFESVPLYFNKDEVEVLIALGEPANREKLYQKVKAFGYRFATYIDELATVSPTAQIGEGVIICPYALIDSQVSIGENSLIEHSCMIGHDATIGSNTVISINSAIGGFTVLGDKVFLGIQTVIKDRIAIGNNVISAMGTVIFKDVENGMTVMGNPGRVTKGREEHRVFG